MTKLLVVSNRAFSETDNNGKTLLNIVKDFNGDEVAQLYFYGNLPSVGGYKYFQLSDKDIIKGRFSPKKRGRSIDCSVSAPQLVSSQDITITRRYNIKRNAVSLLARELIWKNSWKSKQLKEWLTDIAPENVFLMAGDCSFPYDICRWIVNQFNCNLYTYVTDDYVLPRKKENIFELYHRKKIRKNLKEFAVNSSVFFTICGRMHDAYLKEFGVDSKLLINKADSLFKTDERDKLFNSEEINLIYAGSLYYGRDEVIRELSKTIDEVNIDCGAYKRKLHLYICTNETPREDFMSFIGTFSCVDYIGALSQSELSSALSSCDFPVFVESFDNQQIEKTRLSFSTKIPEYLSLGKAIISIGPEGIGSMDCLRQSSICVNQISELHEILFKLVKGQFDVNLYAQKALKKYEELMTYNGLNYYLR